MADLRDISSAKEGAAVTLSDSATIEGTRALYVGVSGDVKVRFVNGGIVTMKAVPVGILPACVNRVYSTGTTATDIVALY